MEKIRKHWLRSIANDPGNTPNGEDGNGGGSPDDPPPPPPDPGTGTTGGNG